MTNVPKGGVTPSIASILIAPANKITGLVAGETLAPGDACYIKNADGAVYKAIAVPLAVPSAPTTGTGASGGALAVGTYGVKVTYLAADGTEGAASTATPQAVVGTGSDDTVTVTSPSASTNATKYRVYITIAGGSTYFLQNGAGTVLGTGYTQTLAIDTSTATAPTTQGTPESGRVRGIAATVAPAAATYNEAVTLLMDMNFNYGLALPVGANLYLSDTTAGALTMTPPGTAYLPVGYVVDSERVHIHPSKY